jgi:hypothetical protein
MRKNLFDLDLQYFAEGEDTGVEDVAVAEPQEDEAPESEAEETDVENGAVEPPKQTDEENARYAAIRRRAEEDAKQKYEAQLGQMNQQIAAMCNGITHPVTGQPITTVKDYVDALQIQQRQASEQELRDKGVDPNMINRMIETNPVVMQAQQVIEQNKMTQAEYALQQDIAAITQYDPSIKGIKDLAALPNFPEIYDRVQRGASLIDAYKAANFDNFMQHQNQAARQQAINQMRGKDHLASQGAGVAQDNDYVEVPPEIMKRMKSDGKTEKQVRELYKTVAGKLHLT